MARWCLIGLICVGIVLQMLGAPLSFCDLDGSDDDFTSSLLMGFCVLGINLYYSPAHLSLLIGPIADSSYSFLYEDILFQSSPVGPLVHRRAKNSRFWTQSQLAGLRL